MTKNDTGEKKGAERDMDDEIDAKRQLPPKSSPSSSSLSGIGKLASLLLGDTNSAATSSGRLRVLSAHAETPVVTKTPVGTDLLESLEVLTHLVVQAVGEDLTEFPVLDILLSVEEPVGDLVLTRIVHDRHDPLHLFLREFSSALGHIDVSFLADDVGKSSTATFDTRHSEHDLTTAINVRVHHTKNVLELFWHH